MMNRRLIGGVSALVMSALLSACGGGGESSGSGAFTVPTTPTPTPTPAPAPAPSPTPSPSPTPTPSAIPTSWTAGIAATYTTQPNIGACQAGTLSTAALQDALGVLNTIRALHSLPPVTLSSTDQQSAMEAALMTAANNQLNHTPPSTWLCYSSLGYAGTSSGNLFLASGTASLLSNTYIFGGWLTELNNIFADNIGHRRWLLDPFVTTVAYGRVAGTLPSSLRVDASVLKVFNNSGPSPVASAMPNFVAYPYGDYPSAYFDTRALLSFTVVADKTTRFGANATVDYSGATITVTPTAGGSPLTVSAVSSDNVGYGVANAVQWKVAGLATNVSYTVSLTNVKVRNTPTDYSYTFRITS